MVRKKRRYRNSYFRVRFVIMVFSALFLSTSIIFGILVINGTESVAASGNSGIIRVNRWPESGETTGLNKKIVRLTETARKQLGEESGKKYWTWYGYENPVDWCGCFVSWCISQAGMTEAGGAPKFSYCQDGILWFSERGLWLPPDSSPRAGMIVFLTGTATESLIMWELCLKAARRASPSSRETAAAGAPKTAMLRTIKELWVMAVLRKYCELTGVQGKKKFRFRLSLCFDILPVSVQSSPCRLR